MKIVNAWFNLKFKTTESATTTSPFYTQLSKNRSLMDTVTNNYFFSLVTIFKLNGKLHEFHDLLIETAITMHAYGHELDC